MPRRAAPEVAAPDLRSRGHRTRDRLLAAGAAVFADRGLHAARVDDIVNVAETSHGTFYLYFSNKEDLFQALAAQVAGELEDLATRLPPLRPGPDGRAALEHWMQAFTEVYVRTGPVIRAWTEAEIVASTVGQLGTNVWAAFTGALIERLREHTAGRGLDPTVAALAIVAMVERANYYRVTQQIGGSDGELPSTLARVTHAAVFGA
jgi:AcrR family transcriptional regulator